MQMFSFLIALKWLKCNKVSYFILSPCSVCYSSSNYYIHIVWFDRSSTGVWNKFTSQSVSNAVHAANFFPPSCETEKKTREIWSKSTFFQMLLLLLLLLLLLMCFFASFIKCFDLKRLKENKQPPPKRFKRTSCSKICFVCTNLHYTF